MLKNAYQLAAEFGVTHTTVYNWIKNGLPCHYKFVGTKQVMMLDSDEALDWLMTERSSHDEKKIQE